MAGTVPGAASARQPDLRPRRRGSAGRRRQRELRAVPGRCLLMTALRWGAACWCLLAAAACYTYAPLETVHPGVADEVSLSLSDQGRAQAAAGLGPPIGRLEGWTDQGNYSPNVGRDS